MLSKNKEIAVKKDFKFQFLVGDLNKKVQVRYFSIFGQVWDPVSLQTHTPTSRYTAEYTWFIQTQQFKTSVSIVSTGTTWWGCPKCLLLDRRHMELIPLSHQCYPWHSLIKSELELLWIYTSMHERTLWLCASLREFFMHFSFLISHVPLGDLIASFNKGHHLFADDIQLYNSVKSLSDPLLATCLQHVNQQMATPSLRNASKAFKMF